MTKNLRKVAVAALTVTMLAGAATAAAAGQDHSELQKVMREVVDAGAVGIQLRVHDQRGEWTGSAGVRKLGSTAKPPTNGRFRIGSSTKTFVATVVLQLVAEGKVGLDTSAARYLPEFAMDPRITVRMLLQHTSGVFNLTGEYYPDGTVVPGITWNGKEWVENTRFKTYRPDDLVRFALAKSARFAPGTDWSYSNTNYVIARLLIENVTGRSFNDELQRWILRPLRLHNTFSPGTDPEIPGPHAHSYYQYDSKTVDVTRQNPSWISSAGDMISTTEDLHTFFGALVGGQLLPAALLAEMRTPHPDPKALGYGLGMFVQDAGCGVTVLNHGGGVQGAATLMYSTPDRSKTLEASVTWVDDDAMATAVAIKNTLPKVLNEVFCSR
ncbi:beta-lactamase family protein [Kibdelosporangium philippinense]|uniref:Beta-lactamase family protein n=1 Tax=Kibdelosporangium philippinense TaxID=211113 RepID=A0ABS8ZPV5_9PSEU|nr:serine hydrolase domain-containing protein [Kibdelosporangium philippinense]MCE7009208.1 beta-lactamase family protein [Kibdelosporangium philippinense]